MKPEHFGRRYSITVCMDGFVSIIDTQDKTKQRRNGSALPAYTVDDITVAFELIERVCTLVRCHHGGKIGTIIEPRVIGWPDNASLRELEHAGERFETEHTRILNHETAAQHALEASRK